MLRKYSASSDFPLEAREVIPTRVLTAKTDIWHSRSQVNRSAAIWSQLFMVQLVQKLLRRLGPSVLPHTNIRKNCRRPDHKLHFARDKLSQTWCRPNIDWEPGEWTVDWCLCCFCSPATASFRVRTSVTAQTNVSFVSYCGPGELTIVRQVSGSLTTWAWVKSDPTLSDRISLRANDNFPVDMRNWKYWLDLSFGKSSLQTDNKVANTRSLVGQRLTMWSRRPQRFCRLTRREITHAQLTLNEQKKAGVHFKLPYSEWTPVFHWFRVSCARVNSRRVRRVNRTDRTSQSAPIFPSRKVFSFVASAQCFCRFDGIEPGSPVNCSKGSILRTLRPSWGWMFHIAAEVFANIVQQPWGLT